MVALRASLMTGDLVEKLHPVGRGGRERTFYCFRQGATVACAQTMTAISALKSLLPRDTKRALRRAVLSVVRRAGYERELGEYVLAEAAAFAAARGGLSSALGHPTVQASIRRHTAISHMNEAHQHLQTAFMPQYEADLFTYYQQQQYLILLTFLGYPFLGPGCLASNVEPFLHAARSLQKLRAIDYGAGIPFGLIYLLRTQPERLESVTIVDQDLIHAQLTEFILSRLCERSGVQLSVLKTRDAKHIPTFEGRYNLVFAKDVLEHLIDPAAVLHALVDKSDQRAIVYADIRDHGERTLQHVSPNLSGLTDVLAQRGFRHTGDIGVVSTFERS